MEPATNIYQMILKTFIISYPQKGNLICSKLAQVTYILLKLSISDFLDPNFIQTLFWNLTDDSLKGL